MSEGALVIRHRELLVIEADCKSSHVCGYCRLKLIFTSLCLLLYQLYRYQLYRRDIPDMLCFVAEVRGKQFMEADMDIALRVVLAANIAVSL